MSATDRESAWVPLAAIALLAACIWIGWSDFDPYVPRGVVQGTIRALPRDIVQLLVQYIIPALLVGFLARRALEWARCRRRA